MSPKSGNLIPEKKLSAYCSRKERVVQSARLGAWAILMLGWERISENAADLGLCSAKLIDYEARRKLVGDHKNLIHNGIWHKVETHQQKVAQVVGLQPISRKEIGSRMTLTHR